LYEQIQYRSSYARLLVVFGTQSCKKEDPIVPEPPAPINPIVGQWKSVGADVAFLLSFAAQIDSIHADFKANNTYTVAARDTSGTILNYAGTYTATKSTSGNIYDVVINQSAPDERTSRGIYETYTASPDSMKYEVVQEVPSIPGFTPPTASGGFGSTVGVSNGWNVQRFRRIN